MQTTKPCVAFRRSTSQAFSLISNDLARDPDVSFAAKGLAVFLLGLPPAELAALRTVADVARRTALHRTTVEKYFDELAAAGFARRGAAGWVVSDERGRSALEPDVVDAEKPRPSTRKNRVGERGKTASGAECTTSKNNLEQQEQLPVEEQQPTVVVQRAVADAPGAVWDAWVQSPALVGRQPRTGVVFTAKRRSLVRRLLADGYSVETLVAAVQGWTRSDFHRGVNERGKVYDSFDLLLRDAKHVDDFAAAWYGQDVAVGPMQEAERAAREDAALGLPGEARATQRAAWAELRAELKSRVGTIPRHRLHPDFAALYDAFAAEYEAWAAGHGRAPADGWRGLLDCVPVLPIPEEPEFVSETAVKAAELELSLAKSKAGPARQWAPEQVQAIAAIDAKVQRLTAGRKAWVAWDEWMTAKPDEAAKSRRWAALRGATMEAITKGGAR